MIAQYIDPHDLWHDNLMKLQKCSTHGYVMWTFFNGATCLNLHGWIVTPISFDEPWVFFFCFFLSWSRQTICLYKDFMLLISSILCSPSLHLLVKTQRSDAFCIGLLPLLSISFLLEAKLHHFLVLIMFLFIIMRKHHCKMYKKRVAVHYPLLYHLKSVLHDHKDQGVLSIR